MRSSNSSFQLALTTTAAVPDGLVRESARRTRGWRRTAERHAEPATPNGTSEACVAGQLVGSRRFPLNQHRPLAVPSGSVRPVATNRQQTNVVQTPQWQQGGWNNGFEDDWGGMGWGNGGGGRGNGWGGQTSNWGGPPPNWAQPQWWLRRAKRD